MDSRALIIMPTYDEAENISLMVRTIMALQHPFHLLIVDDGSPDGTAAIVQTLQKDFSDRLFLLLRSEKQGLGTAYVAGFQWGLKRHYDFFLEMDADFSHNPVDLLKLLKACQSESVDIVVGSRYITGINVINWPLIRILISYGASLYVRLVTRLPVKDSTAGFICYKRRVLEQLSLDKIHFTGYAFQVEMKYRAWKSGFKILELPIVFTDRTQGYSKMSKSILFEAIFGVLRLRWDSIFWSKGKDDVKKVN